MYPQPYFPEPEIIHGNIASEQYDVRLAFIRRTVGWHVLSVLIVYVSYLYLPIKIALQPLSFMLIGLLLLLSAVRKWNSGQHLDWFASLVITPIFLVLLARLIYYFEPQGVLTTSLGVSVLFAALYAVFAGRDFSFMGQFVLSSMAVIVFFGAYGLYSKTSLITISIVVAAAIAYLFFYVYDLASLLQRRKKGEEILAAVDLYRDLVNFITYGFRVIEHWRNFRI
jgi:FtsH-binding integral membrane protein